jgi:branched-subunit amino acid aminotransferase/4-amino-4-deoxychorismate lyase
MRSSAEVLLASTTLWTYSLVRVDGRVIGDGKPGPVAARLKEALQREFSGP